MRDMAISTLVRQHGWREKSLYLRQEGPQDGVVQLSLAVGAPKLARLQRDLLVRVLRGVRIRVRVRVRVRLVVA